MKNMKRVSTMIELKILKKNRSHVEIRKKISGKVKFLFCQIPWYDWFNEWYEEILHFHPSILSFSCLFYLLSSTYNCINLFISLFLDLHNFFFTSRYIIDKLHYCYIIFSLRSFRQFCIFFTDLAFFLILSLLNFFD